MSFRSLLRLLWILLFLGPSVFSQEGESYEQKVERALDLMKNQSKNALKILEEAIMENPMRGEAYLARGRFYYEYESEPFLAGIDFKRGVELFSTQEEREKQAQEVVKITTKSLSSREKKTLEEGDEYLKDNKTAKALKSYIEALKLNSTNAESYYKIGEVLFQMNQKEKSAYFLEQGRLISPVYSKILDKLMIVYRDLNRPEKWFETATESVKYYGESPELNYEFAFYYIYARKTELAKGVLLQNLKAYPKFLRSYFLLSELYISSGQCPAAAPYLEQFYTQITQGSIGDKHVLGKLDWYKEETEKMMAECGINVSE